MILVSFEVNGTAVRVEVEPQDTLLDVLRHSLGLLGSKEGCAEGECGACTVLLDGLPVTACLVLAAKVEGCSVTTIEGVASTWQGEEGALHPVQEAFIDVGAVQCGYCIPGMIVSAVSLLERDPSPDEQTLRQALAGNFCRCTGYNKIFEAVRQAAIRMGGDL